MTAADIAKTEHDLALKKSQLSELTKANKQDLERGLMTAAFGGLMYLQARALVRNFSKPASDKDLDRNMAFALWWANNQWGKDQQTRNLLKGLAGALGNDFAKRGGMGIFGVSKPGLAIVGS